MGVEKDINSRVLWIFFKNEMGFSLIKALQMESKKFTMFSNMVL